MDGPRVPPSTAAWLPPRGRPVDAPPRLGGAGVADERLVATPEVVEFIRRNGGQIYVWTMTMAYGYGRDNIFVLEASVESPGAERGVPAVRG